MDWFVVEGETDGARLFDLVGRYAAVAILPAGATAVRRAWFQRVPRGATVYICLDADEAGEQGARRLNQIVGNAIRVRPPGGVKDWCEWEGSRDDFVLLVQQARKQISRSVKTFRELYHSWKEERSGQRPAIKLGWGSVDHDLRGVGDGQVLGIAARTAVGKSWALATIAHNVSAANAGGLIFSLEMPGPEWFERQWAIFENLPPEQIEDLAKLDIGPPERFLTRMEHTLLCEKPMRLDDVSYICAEARQRLEAPLRCVYVDYLGLLNANGRDAYERTSIVGKGLKELAKDEHVAIIVAMQLSRKGGDGTTPVTLEMMRDSGVIEESMDFLLGLWRPDNQPKEMMVRVLKNRKGQSGRTVKLSFKEPSMQVMEVVA
jgi:replicative DNA helicase